MDLKQYVGEAQQDHDIRFLENRNTRYRIVLKRTALEKGINEINAYKAMPNSSLVDFSIDREGVSLMLHRHSGTSLEELLKQPKQVLRLAENLDIVVNSALLSLKKLHLAGICHGGIRPNRVIIDDDFSVEFVGYGNAAAIDQWTGDVSEDGEFDRYTAPEVVLGGKADGRLADLYSLGKSLFEILKNADCADFDSVGKIYEMCSVIPQKRELFLNTILGKL